MVLELPLSLTTNGESSRYPDTFEQHEFYTIIALPESMRGGHSGGTVEKEDGGRNLAIEGVETTVVQTESKFVGDQGGEPITFFESSALFVCPMAVDEGISEDELLLMTFGALAKKSTGSAITAIEATSTLRRTLIVDLFSESDCRPFVGRCGSSMLSTCTRKECCPGSRSVFKPNASSAAESGMIFKTLGRHCSGDMLLPAAASRGRRKSTWPVSFRK